MEVYAESIEEAIAVWQELREGEYSWGQYRELQLKGLKQFVEDGLELAVLKKVGIGRYERGDGRRGYRNGIYIRTLTTPYGTVDIEVPRLRDGAYEHGLWDKNGLLTDEARELILETYLSGPSTRRVGGVLERVLGYKVSHSTVSAIVRGLNELVAEYWRSPVGDEWEYLILDAIVVKNRGAAGAERRFVLVALGISKSGKKQVLSFMQAGSESEASWLGFLDDLASRGLKGGNLKMVTTDGGAGLVAAVKTCWPRVPRQRCWVHKLRNMASKMRRRNQSECLYGAKLIYVAKNQTEARSRFREWRAKWEEEEPNAVRCLEKDLEEMLEFLDLPEHDQITMRTTNGIERAFREVRRRIRTISCFTNRKSVDRMLFAILTYQNRQWDDAHCRSHFTHKS